MDIHVCFGVAKNCYNPYQSYGEICVGCGCCAKDKLTRIKSRIELHKELLDERINFSGWCNDDPQLLAIQKKNIKEDIKWNKGKIAYYKRQLRKMEVYNDHTD